MTESEWDRCTDPVPMLQYLHGKASERKMRLFLVACARLVWDRIPDPTWRNGVEVGERYADGLASVEELQSAYEEVVNRLICENSLRSTISWASATSLRMEDFFFFKCLSSCCVYPRRHMDRIEKTGAWEAGNTVIGQHQPSLLRDVFNPFRSPSLDPAWLPPSVISLAQATYDDRTFDQLPILGDALEDAGCTDTELLTHLRSPGPHVRGCFALDAVLGKS